MSRVRKIIKVLLILAVAVSPAIDANALLNISSIPDDEFLNMIQKHAFNFFLLERDERTGLIKDRAHNFKPDNRTNASIASTGYGIAAFCIGAERGWIAREEAYEMALTTLRFFNDEMEHKRGFFYHFVNLETGERIWNCEISSIDTAIFLAGALFAGEYFKDTEVDTLAQKIYERVDWQWMMNGAKTLSMGWKPETGFLRPHWSDYNESLFMYLLAIGSPTYPIPPSSWRNISRKVGKYGAFVFVYYPPLFTHQYSHVWVDFRNKHDGLVDYFRNSRDATLANRQFCIDNMENFKTYSPSCWGLTASDGPFGYKAYGSEPGGAIHDGTVAPTAVAGSIIFTPELSIRALRFMYDTYGNKIWGKYGFSDAFNVDENWYARDVIGIDQGTILLMIENYRSELIWRYFMKIPAIKNAMTFVGFREGTIEQKIPEAPFYNAMKVSGSVKIDGNISGWAAREFLALQSPEHIDLGVVNSDDDLSARIAFAWDEADFYVIASIKDDKLKSSKAPNKIYLDDCLEIFIDPDGDGFRWNDKADYQFGFSPDIREGKVKTWEWFHDRDPSRKKHVRAAMAVRDDGYDLEIAIKWKAFGVLPKKGKVIRLSPAVHDFDGYGEKSKLNWFFRYTGSNNSIELGKIYIK